MIKARKEREKERFRNHIIESVREIERDQLIEKLYDIREQEKVIRGKLTRDKKPRYNTYVRGLTGDLLSWMRDVELVLHFLLIQYLNTLDDLEGELKIEE